MIVYGEFEGVPAGFVVPALDEDAPPLVREGLVRRRIVTVEGRCPCGAQRPPMPPEIRAQVRAGGEPPRWWFDVSHNPGCPAEDPAVRAHLHRKDRS